MIANKCNQQVHVEDTMPPKSGKKAPAKPPAKKKPSTSGSKSKPK
jgi:hypothetical protein